MDHTQHKDLYISQLEKLERIINSTNERVIAENPDPLIFDNANFFTKSFLIVMCAYLESYLKDGLMIIVEEMNTRLTTSKLPYNLIKWSLNIDKEFKPTEYKFEQLKLDIEKKKLDDFISGNPFKTKDLFKKFGIDLEKDEVFNSQKDSINAIVTKRNKILHHNDDASDVTNGDLVNNTTLLKHYIGNIDKIICEQLTL